MSREGAKEYPVDVGKVIKKLACKLCEVEVRIENLNEQVGFRSVLHNIDGPVADRMCPLFDFVEALDARVRDLERISLAFDGHIEDLINKVESLEKVVHGR
jgi:hypothetical protein